MYIAWNMYFFILAVGHGIEITLFPENMPELNITQFTVKILGVP